jgi:alpha-beta hydrolase superfamily lysophospholipase
MSINKKVKDLYRKNLFTRADVASDVGYFTSEDFLGLREIPYSFVTEKGNVLSGAFYNYEGYKKGRIVVFDHGMSQCGHRAYMREIEKLARNGYLVYSYDHTGCAYSEGETMGGFSQSLADLDACLCALKNDPEFKGCEFSVIGHSWGAYSCLNIGAFHPDVKHVIALSGFISVKDMHKQLFSGVASFFRGAVYSLEAASNPRHAKSSAVKALNKTDAALLCIHSADDSVVSAKHHFMKLEKALGDRENTKFILLNGKAHNPNYTVDAVGYLGEFLAELTAKRANGELSEEKACEEFKRGYDFYRMTAQDEEVWKEIFKTLEI